MHIYIIYTCVMYITYDLIKILKHRQVEDGHQGRSTKSPFTYPLVLYHFRLCAIEIALFFNSLCFFTSPANYLCYRQQFFPSDHSLESVTCSQMSAMILHIRWSLSQPKSIQSLPPSGNYLLTRKIHETSVVCYHVILIINSYQSPYLIHTAQFPRNLGIS